MLRLGVAQAATDAAARGLIGGVVTVLVMCCPVRAAAAGALADFAWIGTAAAGPGAANWSDAMNWGGSGPSGSVGTLSFPALTSAACAAMPPAATCYQANNDLAGLSANAISIDSHAAYMITGNALSLGAGGLTAAPSGTSRGQQPPVIGIPIALGASQTWSFAGPVVFLSPVTGPAAALSVYLGAFSGPALNSGSDFEVGPITITGKAVTDTLSLFGGGALNATDGSPVNLTHGTIAAFDNNDAIGPLTTADGTIQVGDSLGGGPQAKLAVNGAVTLDSKTMLELFIAGAKPIAGTDYSQLAAAGNVNLANAHLLVLGPCPGPLLKSGQADTLITTTGSLSGTFAGIPDGATIPFGCPGQAPQLLRITYTAHSVTATAVTANAGGTTSASAARASVSGTTASARVTCRRANAAACRITLALTVVETLQGGKVISVTATQRTGHGATRTIIVGTKRVRLPRGHSATVNVPLNATGRRLLKARHMLSAKLTAAARTSGASIVFSSQTVTFKATAKKA